MTLNSNKFFIEIGSSDFDTLLSLSKRGWSGIIVEPVYELLKNLEPNDNVTLENCAISDYNGKIDLQYYDPKWAKGWTRGVGSISKVNHFNWNPQWNEHVVKETIECMTLNELIKKYKVQKIDFLKIDTEGTEYQILNNYNWQIMPSILKVEHKHWGSHGEDKNKYITFLKDKNYIVYEEENDLYCIQ